MRDLTQDAGVVPPPAVVDGTSPYAALDAALEAAIGALVHANPGLAARLGPNHPPASAIPAQAIVHYWGEVARGTAGHPAVVSGPYAMQALWRFWKAVEGLRDPWQAWRERREDWRELLERAIDAVVLAAHALAAQLGPDFPPATAPTVQANAHFRAMAEEAAAAAGQVAHGPGPVFGLWLHWRGASKLDQAWQARLAAREDDLNVHRKGTLA